jgi:hypothetical protein
MARRARIQYDNSLMPMISQTEEIWNLANVWQRLQLSEPPHPDKVPLLSMSHRNVRQV